MFYEFCYYVGITGSLVVTSGGILYYVNRKAFNNILIRVGWNSFKVLETLQHHWSWFDDYINPGNISKVFEEKKHIISYTAGDGQTQTSVAVPPIYDMLFVKHKVGGKTLCKRVKTREEVEHIDFVPIPKPFIQIELKQDGESMEIHDYLEYFYVDGNHILDPLFLKWYMKYWFQVNLSDDYTLHIIDTDVNIVELTPKQSILMTDGTYLIVEDKEVQEVDNLGTENETDNLDEFESASGEEAEISIELYKKEN